MFSNMLELEIAAKYIALGLHSEDNKTSYLEDLRLSYSGEVATYIAQGLSQLITGICIGLLSNYIYYKFNNKYNIDRIENIGIQIKQHKDKINELENLLNNRQVKSVKHFSSVLNDHKNMSLMLESEDEINSLIEMSIKELETRGISETLERIREHDRF
ncbi:MAG: hypothetical protein AB2686_00630 [Candidatus Thiodiazotropha sp.]